MRKVTDWLARLSSLEILAPSFGTRGAALVSIRRFPGWVRVGSGLVAVAFLAYAAWATFTDATIQPVAFGAIFVALAVTFSYGGRLYLTDDVLAHTAAWAATRRGQQIEPGRWRLRGVEAQAIGAELARLHGWRTFTNAPTEAERLRQRERILIDNARGPLREHLQPVLTATGDHPEPLQVESASHILGEPWPVLSHPEPEWPVPRLPEVERPS